MYTLYFQRRPVCNNNRVGYCVYRSNEYLRYLHTNGETWHATAWNCWFPNKKKALAALRKLVTGTHTLRIRYASQTFDMGTVTIKGAKS